MGFVLACAFGYLATRVRLPPIVGYLLAGMARGPFTPGFVGDPHVAAQLAGIGVTLLMFGVGLRLSLETLLNVKNVAISGAVAQIGVAMAIGTGLAVFWRWDVGAGARNGALRAGTPAVKRKGAALSSPFGKWR
jgi:CPA2 family monovalent cation:H+ antiporter-2